MVALVAGLNALFRSVFAQKIKESLHGLQGRARLAADLNDLKSMATQTMLCPTPNGGGMNFAPSTASGKVTAGLGKGDNGFCDDIDHKQLQSAQRQESVAGPAVSALV